MDSHFPTPTSPPVSLQLKDRGLHFHFSVTYAVVPVIWRRCPKKNNTSQFGIPRGENNMSRRAGCMCKAWTCKSLSVLLLVLIHCRNIHLCIGDHVLHQKVSVHNKSGTRWNCHLLKKKTYQAASTFLESQAIKNDYICNMSSSVVFKCHVRLKNTRNSWTTFVSQNCTKAA